MKIIVVYPVFRESEGKKHKVYKVNYPSSNFDTNLNDFLLNLSFVVVFPFPHDKIPWKTDTTMVH
jgi:hypothetical protein